MLGDPMATALSTHFWRRLARGRGPPHRDASPFTMEVMITIVSGLPRSGTSLMMQMLAAGGMSILSDGERRADVDNPRGYLEWERIKQLPKNPGCIAEAEGKAVKVISQLLLSLPAQHEYRVIFMQRPLPEVMASQDEMLRRRGTFDPGRRSWRAPEAARKPRSHLQDTTVLKEEQRCHRRNNPPSAAARWSRWRRSTFFSLTPATDWGHSSTVSSPRMAGHR